MEEETCSIQEAREYLGVYEKIIYQALKRGELQGKKSGTIGNKWLISKPSLEVYKQRIERGEVETRFPLAIKEGQKTYTYKETAQLLGIDVANIYSARDSGIVEKRQDVNGGYILLDVDVAKLKSSRFGNLNTTKELVKPGEEIFLPPAKVEKSVVEKPNDGQLLQEVLVSSFAFLAAHQFPIAFRSLEEVEVDLRLWIMKTHETTLNIVASGQDITILAEQYQRQLEEKLAETSNKLREAETTLSYLRQKKHEVILRKNENYAYDLSVWLEPRPDGFLVWSSLFPFSAIGQTEEDALASFKRVLKGYAWQLRTHEKELSSELNAQFEILKGLLVED